MVGRVLVFGTFDGLHPGHLFFLQKAKSFGDTLFVSVARDQHVSELKHRRPSWNEEERLQKVKELSFVDDASSSDQTLGSFDVIEKFLPDVIVLGYDQTELSSALSIWMNDHKKHIPIRYVSYMGRD